MDDDDHLLSENLAILFGIGLIRRALGIDPNEVIEENVNKLKARYPGGEFHVRFKNRKTR